MAEQDPKASKLTIARRTAVVLIAAATFLVWGSSQLFGEPEICRQELASVGERPVVNVCAPMSAESLLGPVLLIAVLLLPDISELAIPNLITLKRRVNEHAVEQGKIRDELARVEQNQLALQSVNVTVGGYVPPDWERVRAELEGQLRETKDLVAAVRQIQGHVAPFEIVSDASVADAERDRLDAELLRLWRPIESVLGLTRAATRPWRRDEVPELTGHEVEALLEFERVFRSEIQAVRAVRNAVVHEPDKVTKDDLREAIEVARSLNEALRSRPG